MAKKRKKPTCTVGFITGGAVLYDRHGHAINVMNFPRGHRLTAKERARARRVLMTGCAELSRRR